MKKSELKQIIREQILSLLKEEYKEDVLTALIALDPGDKLLKAFSDGKYDKMITTNQNRFPSKVTAGHIRDHWYGV